MLRDFFTGFLCLVWKKCFKRKGQKEREFFGWTDEGAREQERQANENKISYLILLEITARLMEHSFSKC